MYEHAAGATGRIEHGAAVGFNDFHHQLHHRARSKKLAAALAFGKGKLAEEVFVDLAEDIAGGVIGDIVEAAQQLLRQGFHLLGAGQPVVLGFRQAAGQLGLVFLDGLHGLFQRLGDVLIAGQIAQVAVTGMVG